MNKDNSIDSQRSCASGPSSRSPADRRRNINGKLRFVNHAPYFGPPGHIPGVHLPGTLTPIAAVVQAQGAVPRHYDREPEWQWRRRIAAEKAASELHTRRLAEAEPATLDDYAEFLSGPHHPGLLFNGRRLEESPAWSRVAEVLDQLVPTKSYSFSFDSLVKLGRFRPKLTWITESETMDGWAVATYVERSRRNYGATRMVGKVAVLTTDGILHAPFSVRRNIDNNTAGETDWFAVPPPVTGTWNSIRQVVQRVHVEHTIGPIPIWYDVTTEYHGPHPPRFGLSPLRWEDPQG